MANSGSGLNQLSVSGGLSLARLAEDSSTKTRPVKGVGETALSKVTWNSSREPARAAGAKRSKRLALRVRRRSIGGGSGGEGSARLRQGAV